MRLQRFIIFPIAAIPVLALLVAAARYNSPDRRHQRAGLEAEQAGRLQQAEDEYILATRWQPGLGPAWLGLGRVQKAMGRFTAAEGSYRRALELPADGHSEAFDGLCWILLMQSRLDDVEELAQQAQQLGELDAACEMSARRLAAMMDERLRAFEAVCRTHGLRTSSPASFARLRALAASANAAARPELARLLDEAEALCDRALAEAGQAGGAPSRLLQVSLGLLKGPPAELVAVIGLLGLQYPVESPGLADRARQRGAPEEMVKAFRLLPAGSAYGSAAELAEAAELASWTHDPDPRVASAALLALARIAGGRGDANSALSLVSEALSVDPANVAARYELKRVQLQIGSFESAMLDIDPVADSTGPAVIPPDYTEGIVSLVKEIGKSNSTNRPGSFAHAIVKLRSAQQQHPDWLQPRMALAAALYRSGKRDQALTEFTTLAEIAPELIPVQLAMATIHLENRNAEEVIKRCRVVLSAEPGNPQALCMLSEAHLLAARLPDAVEAFRRRIENSRAYDPGLIRVEAEFEQHAARLDREYQSTRSTAAEPKFINASRLAMIYEAQGKNDEAERVLNGMKLDRDGNSALGAAVFSRIVEYQLGFLLARRGDVPGAVKTFSEAADWLESAACKDLAKLLGKPSADGVPAEAVIDALGKQPLAADFAAALGKVCADAGKLDDALRHTQKALRYRPDHLAAATQLSAIHQARARKHLEGVPAALDALIKTFRAPTAADKDQLEKLGAYAQGDPLIKPANTAGDDLLRYLFTILSESAAADAEYAQALPNAIHASVLDPADLARQKEVADIYMARKKAVELSVGCYETLLQHFATLLKALKEQADAVRKENPSLGIIKLEKLLEPHRVNIDTISGMMGKLQRKLAEAQSAADSLARLAEMRIRIEEGK